MTNGKHVSTVLLTFSLCVNRQRTLEVQFVMMQTSILSVTTKVRTIYTINAQKQFYYQLKSHELTVADNNMCKCASYQEL